MKKMISTFAALAVGAAMAEVTSDVVGYDTETTRSGYNYVIPTFRTVTGDKTATDIQQLQLDDSIDSFEVTFQFLTSNRRSAHEYAWISAEDAEGYKEGWSEGQGLWVDADTSAFPEDTVLVGVGNSIQLDMGDYADIPLQCAGKVSDDDLTYETRAGYNYVGNPYPTANSIQNIQLETGIDSFEVTFQFLKANRRSDHEYAWISAEDAEGYKEGWTEGLGLWVDGDTSAFPDDDPALNPGQAVQLDMGEYDGKALTVYSPVEL